MQHQALEKKLTQSKETEIYVVKSQLEAANRKIKDMEQKLETKIKEIKEKDEFIQGQFLRGQKRG